MPLNTLNLVTLQAALRDNTRAILAAIDNDPLLSKRTCPITGLTVANASKGLFTPTETHQLYAKGLVYKKTRAGYSDLGGWEHRYELVAVPLLKIYNLGENPHVEKHVIECVAAGAVPTFPNKEDGTFIMRNVHEGQVILSTRGMLETMHDGFDACDDEADGRFFKWAYQVIDAKYPVLRDPEFYADSELYFELVGPGNRIVTQYDDWDLILIGGRSQKRGEYYDYASLAHIHTGYGLRIPASHGASGNSFAEQAAACVKQLEGSDCEGTVIQFEKGGVVVGRVKAKTETYRTIAALINHCSFAHTAELIEKDPTKYGRNKWQAFKEFLISLGRKKVHEEFLELYKQHHAAYWQYQADVDHFIKGCYQYATIMRLQLQVPGVGKPEGQLKRRVYELVNAKAKLHQEQGSDAAGYFSKYVLMAIDGTIDRTMLTAMHLKTPAIAAECRAIVEAELHVQSEFVRTDLLMIPQYQLVIEHLTLGDLEHAVQGARQAAYDA